jgi:hypothetical protein
MLTMTSPVPEKDFPEHLKSFTPERWKPLFDLIPVLKATTDYGHMVEAEKNVEGNLTFPFHVLSKEVLRFIETVYDLELLVPFEWHRWEQGSLILANPDSRYEDFDPLTLCKILTMIIRADRFQSGFLIVNFNDGTIIHILEALKKKVYSSAEKA